MKKIKLEKGITLIALIITIVVLLILAATAIAAIQGSDIIKYANDASSEHIIGQEKEQIKLAYDSYKISKYTPIERTEDQDELEKYFVGKIFIELVEDLDANPWVIKYSDTEEFSILVQDCTVDEKEENVYVPIEYNGYNYILTVDNTSTTEIKSIELDKNKMLIPLEIADAEVIGNEITGWGITFNNTNNKYTLNNDGTIEEKEFDDNWEMAWVSDGTTWSKKYESGEEITQEYSVIAKMYKTGYTIVIPDEGEFEEYHMIIEGNGQMAPLFTNPNDLVATGVAWQKDIDFNGGWDLGFTTKVTICEGITNVPGAAFVYGVKINQIILPSTLEDIGQEAFGACASLPDIIIPERVTNIGKDAFALCNNLKNIYYKGENAPQGQPWGAPSATVSKFSE